MNFTNTVKDCPVDYKMLFLDNDFLKMFKNLKKEWGSAGI